MRQAAQIATRKKLRGLSRLVLLRLERGQTLNPSPEVLRALSLLYERTYDELVCLFVSHRFGTRNIIVGSSGTGVESTGPHAAERKVGEEHGGREDAMQHQADPRSSASASQSAFLVRHGEHLVHIAVRFTELADELEQLGHAYISGNLPDSEATPAGRDAGRGAARAKTRRAGPPR